MYLYVIWYNIALFFHTKYKYVNNSLHKLQSVVQMCRKLVEHFEIFSKYVYN